MKRLRSALIWCVLVLGCVTAWEDMKHLPTAMPATDCVLRTNYPPRPPNDDIVFF